MAAAGVRVKITLACTECKQRNYNTMKNKRNNPDRIEMSKYCRFCKSTRFIRNPLIHATRRTRM